MRSLECRELGLAELERIREIDRSERIVVLYRVERDELRAVAVDHDVPSFEPTGDGSHSVAAKVRSCERHMRKGARAIGAFAAGTLIGIGLMTPEIHPGLAQLAFLHVSRAHRRAGVAARIFDELLGFARESGARQVYVSSTPSESAVGFYRSRGFAIADPIPELYALEPDDIHMILEL